MLDSIYYVNSRNCLGCTIMAIQSLNFMGKEANSNFHFVYIWHHNTMTFCICNVILLAGLYHVWKYTMYSMNMNTENGLCYKVLYYIFCLQVIKNNLHVIACDVSYIMILKQCSVVWIISKYWVRISTRQFTCENIYLFIYIHFLSVCLCCNF